MKKILFVMLLLILSWSISIEGSSFDLPEVLKPDLILVNGGNLYVMEGDICRLYSLQKEKFLKSFCKPGEGPGEVKAMPGLSAGISGIPGGKMLVEGMNKILIYTGKGDFISEQRKGGRFFRTNKVGDNYAVLRMAIDKKSGKSFLSLSVFSGDFKLIREIYRQEMKDNDRDIEMVIKTIRYSVWKNRVYLAANEDPNPVIVFDESGNELYRFSFEAETAKVDPAFKKTELRRLKEDDFISMMIKREGGWENFRKKMNFIFPDSLPSVQGITVAHNRIHLLTYHRKNEREKFIITDLKGNVMTSVFLPVPMKSSFLAKMLGRENKFYSFSSETYYYLSEDEESELFKLNGEDLTGLK